MLQYQRVKEGDEMCEKMEYEHYKEYKKLTRGLLNQKY